MLCKKPQARGAGLRFPQALAGKAGADSNANRKHLYLQNQRLAAQHARAGPALHRPENGSGAYALRVAGPALIVAGLTTPNIGARRLPAHGRNRP